MDKVPHNELHSMKSTNFKGRAQNKQICCWTLDSTLLSAGDLDLEDKPRSGRPTKLNSDDLIAAVEDKPSLSARELASELGLNSLYLTATCDGIMLQYTQ
ncbi:hypothetical protein KIN20_026672 [Parelaphostrongylus tenuis]|uniref:Uncharacterized protein n=1 Tax=Parelaphostrongylus tenuis TaxID=148309 RepID=A0AAD5WD93_PARTN|nr:hypothetical protein KIN20_026672 [Parelaphostrongylus tenuis]